MRAPKACTDWPPTPTRTPGLPSRSASRRPGTEADWKRLEEEHFSKGVSPRLLLVLVPWIADELPSEVRDRLLREGGTGVRLIWLATRRRYARRDRGAFRYS